MLTNYLKYVKIGLTVKEEYKWEKTKKVLVTYYPM